MIALFHFLNRGQLSKYSHYNSFRCPTVFFIFALCFVFAKYYFYESNRLNHQEKQNLFIYGIRDWTEISVLILQATFPLSLPTRHHDHHSERRWRYSLRNSQRSPKSRGDTTRGKWGPYNRNQDTVRQEKVLIFYCTVSRVIIGNVNVSHIPKKASRSDFEWFYHKEIIKVWTDKNVYPYLNVTQLIVLK